MGCKVGGFFFFCICLCDLSIDVNDGSHNVVFFFFCVFTCSKPTPMPNMGASMCNKTQHKFKILPKCVPFFFIFRLVYGCVSHKCHNFEICCHLNC